MRHDITTIHFVPWALGVYTRGYWNTGEDIRLMALNRGETVGGGLPCNERLRLPLYMAGRPLRSRPTGIVPRFHIVRKDNSIQTFTQWVLPWECLVSSLRVKRVSGSSPELAKYCRCLLLCCS